MTTLRSINHRIALNPSFCTQAPYPFNMSSTLPRYAASTERMSGEQPSVEMVDCSDRVKLLQYAAKLIKSEVTDCRGIAIRPHCVVDSSLTNAKSLIPDSLYCMVSTPDNCHTEKEDDDRFHHHDRWLSNRVLVIR